ncbi:MAG: tRNA (N(6)-L-threonylcarbamoyladenosine(37)-C(2))-methylthiotransferase MtaB [Clostridia bacterium]|nr:tRNA (N(6)-L-threonylcarbamoyladenosine(37)-C(2))-methylthiotransferase MtaB [Clostridia bacterium]
MQKVCLLNLGCKVNQYEIDGILNSLKGKYETTTELEFADIYIVNTCAVTQEAEKKSRQIIAKIEKVNPNGKIYICGCAAQNDPDQFLTKKQVEYVIGTYGKGKLKDNFDKKGSGVVAIPKTYEDDLMATNVRTRGYIKVQDGCNNYCAYCLIPFLRGRSRSRALESVMAEAMQLSKTCKEIVITGINISDYRINGNLGLNQLMKSLGEVPARIRIGSLEVNIINEQLLQTLKEMPNFCPSFHLSLQSGSDKVLWEMNRHYTTKEYLNKVNMVRRYFPNAAITTDLIVGYPTETQKDFDNTLNFIKTVGFSSVHYFAYSSRKGTKAGALPQINGTIIKEREEKLRPVVEEMSAEYLNQFIAHPLDVLVEEQKGMFFEGFSENYIRCYIDSEVKIGEIVKVMPVSINKNGLLCKVIA